MKDLSNVPQAKGRTVCRCARQPWWEEGLSSSSQMEKYLLRDAGTLCLSGEQPMASEDSTCALVRSQAWAGTFSPCATKCANRVRNTDSFFLTIPHGSW